MGGRAGPAAFYPTQLILEILRCIRNQEDVDHQLPEGHPDLLAAVPAQALLHDLQPDLVHAIPEPGKKKSGRATTARFTDGTARNICLDDHFKNSHVDEYTGEQLPHHQLQDAMLDELPYFNEHVLGDCSPSAGAAA